MMETASFPIIWEHGVLPFLVEFIPKWCGPGHVISVSRGNGPNKRRICIMTRTQLSRARRLTIAVHVRDLLPDSYKSATTFAFSTGQVNRLVWARGLGKSLPDEICFPRNPFLYGKPCMGDSIGIRGNGTFQDSTSTLGPCITVGGGSYWLANFHPFADAFASLESVSVEHPSPCDRSRCLEEAHDAMDDIDDFKLGSLTATSGLDLKTTRITHDPYWEECDKDSPLVVTDWSIIMAKSNQANVMRRFPSEAQPLLQLAPVKSTAHVSPGSIVCSSGRTSGHQRGLVCEIPAHVSGDAWGNGTGRATREWFIEEPDAFDGGEDGWIRGGIGVEGDSGAAIIEMETNTLVGQLWGRNCYWGPGPRHTFFTPICDIFDDIQERCGQQGRPQLPRYRDEADRYPVYPACRHCYDLQAYQSSRRSSRESLRSMVMGGGGLSHSEQDLTSLEAQSELATPKDSQQYWLRHAGMDDSMISGIVSPCAAASTSFHQPGTPGIVGDMRSPYATTLHSEDLYDAEYAPPGDTGKRVALPLVKSSATDVTSNKKQRME